MFFMFIDFIMPLMIFIPILLAVAFFTLIERKVLSYMQNRKGPAIVGHFGIIQPISDGVKLLTKENLSPLSILKLLYFLAPTLSLFIMFVSWNPCYKYSLMNVENIFLLFLGLSGVSVLLILMGGWASNSSYSLMGGIRAAAQMISYEVVLSFILVFPLFFFLTFDFKEFYFFKKMEFFFLLSIPFIYLWLSSLLAETNRAPFDLAEGESELVSGFNTEFSSGPFALFFLAEYGLIILMSWIAALFFFGGEFYFFLGWDFTPLMPFSSIMLIMMKTSIISFLVIWARASFPRKRYDLLMDMMWTSYFPFLLFLLLAFLFFKTI